MYNLSSLSNILEWLGTKRRMWTAWDKATRPGLIAVILGLIVLLIVNEFSTPFSFSVKLMMSASNYASVLCGALATSIMIQLTGLLGKINIRLKI